MSKVKSVILAARPKTLPAAVVPVWAGCVLAWKLTGKFDGWLAFFTLAGAICIQIATNFFNDAIDAGKGADTEKRLGPVRVTSSGLMSRRTVIGWAVAFCVLAFGIGSRRAKPAKLGEDQGFVLQHDEALHHVFELADIARPLV